eukprot:m.221300 g.221300  ORF g.221300 m.221300 type:complete len:704 (+) comp10558_c0_seq1:112-2223(+)
MQPRMCMNDNRINNSAFLLAGVLQLVDDLGKALARLLLDGQDRKQPGKLLLRVEVVLLAQPLLHEVQVLVVAVRLHVALDNVRPEPHAGDGAQAEDELLHVELHREPALLVALLRRGIAVDEQHGKLQQQLLPQRRAADGREAAVPHRRDACLHRRALGDDAVDVAVVLHRHLLVVPLDRRHLAEQALVVKQLGRAVAVDKPPHLADKVDRLLVVEGHAVRARVRHARAQHVQAGHHRPRDERERLGANGTSGHAEESLGLTQIDVRVELGLRHVRDDRSGLGGHGRLHRGGRRRRLGPAQLLEALDQRTAARRQRALQAELPVRGEEVEDGVEIVVDHLGHTRKHISRFGLQQRHQLDVAPDCSNHEACCYRTSRPPRVGRAGLLLGAAGDCGHLVKHRREGNVDLLGQIDRAQEQLGVRAEILPRHAPPGRPRGHAIGWQTGRGAAGGGGGADRAEEGELAPGDQREVRRERRRLPLVATQHGSKLLECAPVERQHIRARLGPDSLRQGRRVALTEQLAQAGQPLCILQNPKEYVQLDVAVVDGSKRCRHDFLHFLPQAARGLLHLQCRILDRAELLDNRNPRGRHGAGRHESVRRGQRRPRRIPGRCARDVVIAGGRGCGRRARHRRWRWLRLGDVILARFLLAQHGDRRVAHAREDRHELRQRGQQRRNHALRRVDRHARGDRLELRLRGQHRRGLRAY